MSENKIIAKNSLILYFRLLVTTIIGLYTTRIVLLELGVDNYGVYVIVGGIVAMMNFMNTSMISTSNRFIAVELGKKEDNNTNKIFNILLSLHILFSIFLLLIGEFVGVWYINNHLNVDVDKIPDALFVMHLSIVSVIIGTVVVPYQGLITMHEKFNVRATIEILRSLLNLGMVFLLVYHTGNKLRAYALYMLLGQIFVSIMYFVYCNRKYGQVVKWKLNRKKSDYIDVSKFFGWQLVYVVGAVGSSQGGNIIINLFFGTVLNAAFGIATKVNGIVFLFVKNLNQAAIPQIMKNYSGGNQDRSLMLIYKLSKFTFFVMLIPAVPIFLSIDSILIFWLKEVPEYTKYFVVLFLIRSLVSCLESGFDPAIDATGKIKKTKIIYSILFLSILPVSYILFKLKFPPYTIAILYIGAELIFLFVQTRILTALTEFKISKYISKTILPVVLVTILIIPQHFLLILFGEGLINLIIISSISVLLTVATIYFVGISKEERTIITANASKLKIFKRFMS